MRAPAQTNSQFAPAPTSDSFTGPQPSEPTQEELFELLMADEALLILLRCEGRKFQLLGKPPAWAYFFSPGAFSGAPFLPAEHFPFLDHFLDDAEQAWASQTAYAVTSGIWTE